jgi:FtsH-binding integral membrane protein
MTPYDVLVIMHIIGTVLGVGAATFAEIHYTRFASDDIITDDERKTLATTYTVMRAGLFLLALSGFGFLLYFRLTENVEILLSPAFWAKMTVVAVLIGNALLLQMRLMPFAVGTAVSLTSWYTALVLGVIRPTDTTYVEFLVYYGVAIVLVGVVLRWIRARTHASAHI